MTASPNRLQAIKEHLSVNTNLSDQQAEYEAERIIAADRATPLLAEAVKVLEKARDKLEPYSKAKLDIEEFLARLREVGA